MLSFHNLKIKKFSNNLRLVVKSAQIYKQHDRGHVLRKKCKEGTKERLESIERSYRHVKDKVYNIAYSNDFDFFVTITISPQTANRYSYYDCALIIQKELKKLRRKYNEFEYLMVPEQHKDGAWHYHALFKGLPMIEYKKSGKKDKKGRIIYNLSGVSVGFTTAQKVDSRGTSAGYLVKYITKEMIRGDYVRGRRKYWASRGADKVEIIRDYVEDWSDFKDKLLKENDLISTKTSKVNKIDYKNELTYWLLAQP